MMRWLTLAVALAFCMKAYAAAVYVSDDGSVRVTLYDEDCALKEVRNLKRRATWEEKGQLFQGCYGQHPETGIVIAYFDDGSVVLIPPQAFRPVRSV